MTLAPILVVHALPLLDVDGFAACHGGNWLDPVEATALEPSALTCPACIALWNDGRARIVRRDGTDATR